MTCIEDTSPPFWTCACPDDFQCRFCNLTSVPCSVTSDYCDHEHTAQCQPAKNDNETCDRPTCQCKPGWQGIDCGDDIDECSLVPPVCENGGNCTNTIGSFTCHCEPDFGWIDCSKPANCFNHTSVCAAGATCKVVTIGNYTYGQCQCQAGETGDGYHYCNQPGEDYFEVGHCEDDPHCMNHEEYFDYMGTCPVTFMRNLRPIPFVPDFKVVVKSSNHFQVSNKVSFVDKIYLEIHGHRFIFHAKSDRSKLVEVDTEYVVLPYRQVENVTISEIEDYGYCVNYFVQTPFGLRLKIQSSWDFDGYESPTNPEYHGNLYAYVPAGEGSILDNVGGMGVSFEKPDGSRADNATDLGDSWAGENIAGDYDSLGCIFGADVEGDSKQEQADKVWAGSQTKCSLYADPLGPFEDCFKYLDSQYVERSYRNCIYDVARYRPQGLGYADNIACSIHLEKFAAKCYIALQQHNITDWLWRRMAGCPDPVCGGNATFVNDAPQCVATCENPYAIYNCPTKQLVQRCMCKLVPAVKYVFSNGKCISLKECPTSTTLNVNLYPQKSEVDVLCRADCLWLGPDAAYDGLFCKPLKCADNAKSVFFAFVIDGSLNKKLNLDCF